ncbi:MAG: PAS domain S-box protein [Chlorobi bacterium]|nr:PAS domain S-box protein [Chlorobiota bacterium]
MVKNKKTLKRSSIILIFFALAIIMVSSAIIELYQGKKNLYELMEQQSHTLLESIIIASQNSLIANNYLEEISQKRLLNNASFIHKLLNDNLINNRLLKDICRQNDIFSINIFNKKKEIIYSSQLQNKNNVDLNDFLVDKLMPVFNRDVDTLIIGLSKAVINPGYHYIVAITADTNGVIVLNANAEQYLEFKRHTGFGPLIRNVANDNPNIIYIALQDSFNILAATGNVRSLEPIQNSYFLSHSLTDSVFGSRISDFDSVSIFETVHPFAYNNETIGIIRMGLSTKPLDDINLRIYRRLIIITIILTIIGFFMVTFIFVRQRLNILQREYEVVETYSGNIIDNVSDAIIVINNEKRIRVFNNAAALLFGKLENSPIDLPISDVFNSEECDKILNTANLLIQLNCKINNKTKYLLISKSSFSDSNNEEYTIIVVKDLTEQKSMEEQIERKQRMTAMGELASGVAHEIRNPLNAISTIIQQLKKDFKPKNDTKEYNELTGIVYSEVNRINNTIKDFLRFARPEPIQASGFILKELLEQLTKQYESVLNEKNIDLNITFDYSGSVYWDKNQIKQVLINLIQNAIEAIHTNGKINIEVRKLNNEDIELIVEDTGAGMDSKTKENIFNLYFTTKAKGTGIGLSIVQRIIYEHGGVIAAESIPGVGTTFKIKLPLQTR